MSRLLDLGWAIVSELEQRYEMACLLDRLRKDERILDDIGFTYDWLAKEVRQGQHDRSPIRKALHRRRKAEPAPVGRAAHDLR